MNQALVHRSKTMPLDRWRLPALTLLLGVCISACKIRDEAPRTNQLSGLRVLALASEPADVVQGETVAMSALVFDEAERDIDYQWSWCLARNSSEEEGYGCAISESELQSAWAELDTGTELPGYDLGTDATATLDVRFGPDEALAVCEILSRDKADPELAFFECATRLGLSFELRAIAGEDQIVAIKDVPFAASGDERNQNPSIGETLARIHKDDGTLAADSAFLVGETYELIADVAMDASEVFLPAARDGLPPPEPRGESLFLTWFVTQGATHRSGEQRTAYHDTGFFDSLIENSWEMPLSLDDEDIQLYLVLRDERGGTSWREYEFRIAEPAP